MNFIADIRSRELYDGNRPYEAAATLNRIRNKTE